MSNTIRYVHTSFCDDVRHEQGNKLSLMGIYPGSLVVPGSLPGTIQKLCVVIEAHTPLDHPFSRLTLQLRKDDKVVEELIVPDAALQQLSQQSDTNVDLKMGMVGTIFIVQGLPVEKPGLLSVVAITEREELLGGRLHIQTNAEVPAPLN